MDGDCDCVWPFSGLRNVVRPIEFVVLRDHMVVSWERGVSDCNLVKVQKEIEALRYIACQIQIKKLKIL
jgi:hypothetical protein